MMLLLMSYVVVCFFQYPHIQAVTQKLAELADKNENMFAGKLMKVPEAQEPPRIFQWVQVVRRAPDLDKRMPTAMVDVSLLHTVYSQHSVLGVLAAHGWQAREVHDAKRPSSPLAAEIEYLERYELFRLVRALFTVVLTIPSLQEAISWLILLFTFGVRCAALFPSFPLLLSPCHPAQEALLEDGTFFHREGGLEFVRVAQQS